RGGRILSRLPVARGHAGGQGLVFGARVVALATVQGRSGASGAFPPRIGLLLAGEDGARPGQAALATAAAARPRHQGGRVAVDQRARSARTQSPTDCPTVSLAVAQRRFVSLLQADVG